MREETNLTSTFLKLKNELSSYKVLTPSEEKKLLYKIDQGKSLPIYTMINILPSKEIKELEKGPMAKLNKPCINFEILYSTLVQEKNAVSIMKNLYKDLFPILNTNRIYQYYIVTYMEAMLKKGSALSYEELNALYKEDNFFNSFSKEKATFHLEEQLTTFKEFMEARETLINSNIKLVVSIAKRYALRAEILDLVQEGISGVEAAIDKFDTKKNAKFSTYATWQIRQKMTRYIQNNGMIRKPVYLTEKLMAVEKEKNSLEQELGTTITLEEQAYKTKLDFLRKLSLEKRIDKLQEYASYLDPLSLDESYSIHKEEKDSLMNIVSFCPNEVQDKMEESYLKADIEEALSCLSEREREVIQRRFGINYSSPQTFEEIGKELHLSKERICQISRTAMHTLKTNTYLGKNKLKAYRP